MSLLVSLSFLVFFFSILASLKLQTSLQPKTERSRMENAKSMTNPILRRFLLEGKIKGSITLLPDRSQTVFHRHRKYTWGLASLRYLFLVMNYRFCIFRKNNIKVLPHDFVGLILILLNCRFSTVVPYTSIVRHLGFTQKRGTNIYS